MKSQTFEAHSFTTLPAFLIVLINEPVSKLRFTTNAISRVIFGKIHGAVNLVLLVFNDDIVEGCESVSYVNNALLKYDIDSKNISILRGYDIRNITVVNDSLASYVIVIYQYDNGLCGGMLDMSGTFFGTSTHKVWRSSKCDFGHPLVNKVLKEISFKSVTDGELSIWCDGVAKSFKFEGREAVQKIKPYIRGKSFGVVFSINANNCKLSKPTIKVGFVK